MPFKIISYSLRGDTLQNWIIRYTFFLMGVMLIAFGTAITIKMKHLGLAPWDVISVALYQKFGLSIGTWTVLMGIFLIILTLIMRGKHINIGTFLNTLLLGPMLDFFLSTDILPNAAFSWTDYLWLFAAIAIM